MSTVTIELYKNYEENKVGDRTRVVKGNYLTRTHLSFPERRVPGPRERQLGLGSRLYKDNTQGTGDKGRLLDQVGPNFFRLILGLQQQLFYYI